MRPAAVIAGPQQAANAENLILCLRCQTMSDSKPVIKAISDPVSVPVFSCRLFVAPKNPEGVVVARCANLENVRGEGDSERAALQKAVAAFKAQAVKHEGDPNKMPWIDPPLTAEPNEQERLMAVHL